MPLRRQRMRPRQTIPRPSEGRASVNRRVDGAVADAEEGPDAQMPPEPFEKRIDPPAGSASPFSPSVANSSFVIFGLVFARLPVAPRPPALATSAIISSMSDQACLNHSPQAN